MSLYNPSTAARAAWQPGQLWMMTTLNQDPETCLGGSLGHSKYTGMDWLCGQRKNKDNNKKEEYLDLDAGVRSPQSIFSVKFKVVNALGFPGLAGSAGAAQGFSCSIKVTMDDTKTYDYGNVPLKLYLQKQAAAGGQFADPYLIGRKGSGFMRLRCQMLPLLFRGKMKFE